MVTVTAKRNIQRKVEVLDGKSKTEYFKKGMKYEIDEKEAVKFWGILDIKESDKKRLLSIAKKDGLKRAV